MRMGTVYRQRKTASHPVSSIFAQFVANLDWPLKRSVTMCLTAAFLVTLRSFSVNWKRLSHTPVAKPFLSLCGIDTLDFASSPLGRSEQLLAAARSACDCMVVVTLLLFFRHFGDSDCERSGLSLICHIMPKVEPRSSSEASQLSLRPPCPPCP